MAAMISRAKGTNGTTCGNLFFVLLPSRLQVSPSNSPWVIRATSLNRPPVSSKTRKTDANGSPTSSQARQKILISLSSRTRSLDSDGAGESTSLIGLVLTQAEQRGGVAPAPHLP